MSAPDTATVASSSSLQSTAASVQKPVHPFYWSVRRELWEHRSLYLAPSIVAAVLLLALLAGAFKLPEAIATFDTFTPARQRDVVTAPYAIVALVLVVTGMIVALFYCLDALHGERRDRSALFWKSMPISDRTTVLAKLAVPMAAVPIFLFALIAATQLVMLAGNVLLWGAKGLSVGNLLQQLPLLDMPLGVAHMVVTFAIWYAPIYAWLLLVSAWAQRSPLAWAVVPWIAAIAFEQLVLRTGHLARWLRGRFVGGFDAAFSSGEEIAHTVGKMQREGALPAAPTHGGNYAPDVLRFLGNPDVWIGVAIAAVLIIATIWLRRRQESQSG